MRLQNQYFVLLWVLALPIRLISAATQIFDDRDPRVQYISGSWAGRGANGEYRETTSESTSRGDIVEFNFFGKPISHIF